MRVRLNKTQLQSVVRGEGCDCSEGQWDRRAEHCTMKMIRCSGRWNWLKANDAKFCMVWGFPPPEVK